MQTLNIHEAKTHFSQLVTRAAAGEEIVIARGGKPVARLVPYGDGAPPRRVLGAMEGLISVADDFDAPLPADVLAGFLGDDVHSAETGESISPGAA